MVRLRMTQVPKKSSLIISNYKQETASKLNPFSLQVLEGAFKTDPDTKKEFFDNIKLQQEFAPR